MYFETLFVLFLFFFGMFVLGQVLKDNSIVDIGWGAGFVLSAIFTFIWSPDSGMKGILITVAIAVWGTRLTYHIAKRNLGKPEDYRYVNMRKGWGDKYVWIKAFFQVYFIQFVIQYIVTLPVIYGNSTEQSLKWFNYIGVVLWMVGFFFESFGDYQLKVFKKKPENKGKLMDQGLWSLTRHPNYFGDSAMWFGIFFIALTDVQGIWIAIGPSLMTFFLVFVSGVRMLEKKYVGRADYDAYKQRTSSFLPWFPKKT